MKKLKLAFCLYRYFPFGGLQRDFHRIVEECIFRGHEVDIYTMEWEGEKIENCKIHVLPITAVQNHAKAKKFVEALTPLLAEEAYDAVIGFNKMPGLDVYYAADTCYKAKAANQHGAWYRLLPRYRHWVEYEKAVFAKELTTQVLLLSNNQQKEFTNHYETPVERLHLLTPGIARDRIAPDNANLIRNTVRNRYHLNQDNILLLMIGSGFKTKGLDRTLKAIAALPDRLRNKTQLFVIGQDHSRQFLKMVSRLGIEKNVKFLGGRDDVPSFLLAADLLVHPAYNENTGTVLLEAMVAGLPVLTTDVCGYAHYVTKAKAGVVLAAPFEQNRLNETLRHMLSSDLSIQRRNGLQFAKEADIYQLHQHAVDKIESLIS